MTDYAEIYNNFYSKYYSKAENLIKFYLIKCKSENRPFGYANNQTRIRLRDYIMTNLNIEKYDCLKPLHQLFIERYSSYSSEEIQGVFNREIRIDYAKVSPSELPINYSYHQLIKDIAIFEIVNELLRLLQNNSALFERFYKINDYQKFEIKEYGDILERTSIYKELDEKLHPQYYNSDYDLAENKSKIEHKEPEYHINISPSLFINGEVSTCFLHYVENYILNFFTDYSYLKRRLETENLIHNKTDNDFMSIIFKELKLISDKKYDEYLMKEKLTSLTKCTTAYRETNFNIVFKSVINIKN